ncbi:MAG: hypothetical protein AAGI53_03345 [Planctomycetota bacterium]
MTEPGPRGATDSLLDESDLAQAAPKPPSKLQVADAKLRATLGATARWPIATKRRRIASSVVGLLALAGAGVGAWLAVRTQPPPDYATAPIDTIFEYTLLTDDFNKLSVEERLALIAELVKRMEALGGGDSVLLALFASMIVGEARAQLEENVSRLAVDLFDSYAVDYDPNAPIADRRAYLEETFLKFTGSMAAVAGEDINRSDEERLERARRSAQRDMERVTSGRVDAGETLRAFDLLNNGMGRFASGHQKIRIATMSRDMVEMLRTGP